MAKTHEGRISSLETVYTEIVTPMREDVREIKTNVQKISLQMPEILKHVNNNNGNRNNRKYDKKKYKIIIWASIIGASGAILLLIGKLGSMLITFGEILEQLPDLNA